MTKLIVFGILVVSQAALAGGGGSVESSTYFTCQDSSQIVLVNQNQLMLSTTQLSPTETQYVSPISYQHHSGNSWEFSQNLWDGSGGRSAPLARFEGSLTSAPGSIGQLTYLTSGVTTSCMRTFATNP